MRKKLIKLLLAIVMVIGMLPMTAFAQEINMDEEMVSNPTGEVKAEFEVDSDFAYEMGYDLIVSFPLNISLTYDSETEAFVGTDEVYAYGITGGDTMVQVAINKEHSGYGRLLGPATERYDISSTVSETIDGEEKGTVSADDCYYNLLAVKGMDGKSTEDISTMDLSVEVPADSFIPRYRGTYYTCVPLVITIEETEMSKATGLYGNDGIAFAAWDEMTANVGSYYDDYREKTIENFSVFYLEDNGEGYTLTSNYEVYYMYSIDGEEFISTEIPNTEEIDNGKYNTGYYNYSCSYLNNTYDYISGNLVLPEGITVLGEHAFDCMTNFRAVVLPDSLTTIKSHAFDNQWNAITITMSTGVTTIEDNAFLNASGLTDIYYEGTQEQWNAINVGETGNDILSTVTIHYIAEY